MVQVVVDGRDLEPISQVEDILDIVESVVVFDDETVLDGFGQALEVLGEAIQSGCFVSVDAADMQDDFIGRVGAERGQYLVVVNEIFDGARDDILRR